MYNLVKSCRGCGGTDLTPCFSLGIQPPSNDFCKPDEPRAGFAPLDVLWCSKCGLSQLSVVVDPEILYRRYLYTSSESKTMQRHFERLMMDIDSEQNGLGRIPKQGAGSILEIGSNTGNLLSFCKENGYAQAIGIDPARNLAEMAAAKGVETIPEFFDAVSAETALERIGHPSVILARHCFAHMNDWRGFIEALEVVADANTLICIETPWVHDMLKRIELDTIYFEHLSYVNLGAITELLKVAPFNIHRVQRYSIHGGALLIMLRHKDSKVPTHISSDEFVSEDTITLAHWNKFAVEARANIEKLRDTIQSANKAGKRVCGFGASAKATVWINTLGLTKKDLLFVSDNSPFKPGCLVPGKDIPVIDQDEFLSEHPDIAVCFAWNYKQEILKDQRKWLDRGGRFIFPTV